MAQEAGPAPGPPRSRDRSLLSSSVRASRACRSRPFASLCGQWSMEVVADKNKRRERDVSGSRTHVRPPGGRGRCPVPVPVKGESNVWALLQHGPGREDKTSGAA